MNSTRPTAHFSLPNWSEISWEWARLSATKFGTSRPASAFASAPSNFDRFQDFLPNRPGILQLVELTRYLLGQALAFDVQLVLSAPQVPGCQLDR